MNDSDATVPAAVRAALPSIVAAIDGIVARMAAGGRLIYVGAGSSGASACSTRRSARRRSGPTPATSWRSSPAGRRRSSRRWRAPRTTSTPGAAPSTTPASRPAMRWWASRRAGARPFVIAALGRAGELGALTVGLSCNTGAELSAVVRAPDRGGRRPRGGDRLDAAQGRHGAEARAQHDLHHHDGAPRQDVREPDGRPAPDQREAAGAGGGHRGDDRRCRSDHRRGPALEATGFDVKAAVLVASLGVTPNEARDRLARRRRAAQAGTAGGNEPMKVLGMISGTSHDGIDAAVVDLSLTGDELTGVVVHADSTPYRPDLRARLVAAFPPASTTLAEVCELDTLIGQAFAEVAAAVVAGVPDVELIVSHGQTVFHWVEGAHALGHAPARAGRVDRRAHRRAGRVRRAHPRHHRRRPRCAARVVPRHAAARRHRRAGGGAEPRWHLEHDGRRPGRGPSTPSTSDRRTRSSTRWWRAPAPTPTATTPAGAWPRPDRCTTACWPCCSTTPTTTCRHRRAPARSTSTATTSTPRWRAPASIWPSATWSPR